MTGNSAMPVLVPVGTIGQKLDNDDPDYIFAPDLYLGLALAYDSLAAPGVSKGADGVLQPRYDPMQPRLAVQWEEQPNGDWIVRLRPGVRTHAGNEFTAEDLAWVYDKIDAQGVMAAWRWREVVGLQKLEIVDRHTVRYQLRSPYPTFPNWLLSVSPNMVDSTAIRAHATPDDPWGIAWLNANVAGAGAYDLAAMDAEHLLFTRRADYWMGLPEAEAVEVRAVGNRADALRMLDEGQPVVLAGLDPDTAVGLLKRDDLTVLRTWAGHVSVEIDFTVPPFDDPRVRHALAYATPVDRLIAEGLLGQARRWRSPVKSISQWYSDDAWHYDHNIPRARELLAAAGYANGLKSDFYIAQRADSLRMAEIIAAAWRQVGVELVMRDLSDAPPGWLPPLFLRTECAHNLSEPIYDLAHDYAAMNPIMPLPGGPPHVGNWRPRWKKNDGAIERFTALLCECDAGIKRHKFSELQSWLVDFGSSIFIAEGHQVMAANRHVPAGLIAPESRFFQALNHQNCTTNYLPR
jgi:peptide/nickel transport system substrate-binding protein